ncbi:sterile alpha motif domain-containing protein 15-like [Mya arenaria]|uniref:sterile alpha motif domain-containing protein 15-like n=1 Tax=Mya arenaria TaxID=6604 RepID=UPI0022E03A22|nr:sterile alpha motif domain-containing protein 15-like [Mya arenaria]
MNDRPSRFVLEADTRSGVPMAIYWTSSQVADWVVEQGYPQYRDCFITNHISGRHLLYMDASSLPNIGVTNFLHIRDLAGKIRGLIGVDHIIKNMSISMSDPMIAYINMKRRSGRVTQNTPYRDFFSRYRRWFK